MSPADAAATAVAAADAPAPSARAQAAALTVYAAGSLRAVLAEIVADFEARDQHLSGVAIADTALVLERLAEPRGMAVRPSGPLVPR